MLLIVMVFMVDARINVVLLIVMVLMLGDVVEHPLRDER